MRDRSPVWIGTVDLCLAVLAVVIVAVNPKGAAEGVHERGEYLLTVDWDINQDADVDIWLLPPTKKPVFYGSRDVGCARLDSDNRGFLDGVVTLADGSTTRIESSKETIQLRCIEPGHFELAANLYAYREKGLTAGTSQRHRPESPRRDRRPQSGRSYRVRQRRDARPDGADRQPDGVRPRPRRHRSP